MLDWSPNQALQPTATGRLSGAFLFHEPLL